jgi:hypothetical protein
MLHGPLVPVITPTALVFWIALDCRVWTGTHTPVQDLNKNSDGEAACHLARFVSTTDC